MPVSVTLLVFWKWCRCEHYFSN